MQDYELEFDGKKLILPASMTQPKVDLNDLPEAEVQKPRLRKRKKPEIPVGLGTMPPDLDEFFNQQNAIIGGAASPTFQTPTFQNIIPLIGAAIVPALFAMLKK